MTDVWPIYESRLKVSCTSSVSVTRSELSVNQRQYLVRLSRKSLSLSKSVELHDKVTGHYLNTKYYL
ncbi:IS1 family transposase [Enterobacter sp. MW07]|nr:IS1 family transposase [Enterobacter sp. MW07]